MLQGTAPIYVPTRKNSVETDWQTGESGAEVLSFVMWLAASRNSLDTRKLPTPVCPGSMLVRAILACNFFRSFYGLRSLLPRSSDETVYDEHLAESPIDRGILLAEVRICQILPIGLLPVNLTESDVHMSLIFAEQLESD